jgi:SAM-dependent methyltransferase
MDDPGVESRQAYYRTLAAEYRAFIRQLVPAYDEMTEALLELVRAAAPSSILDVGCGSGELTLRLAEAAPAASVTALEVSPAMAEEARACLRGPAPRVQVVERDVREVDPEKGRLPGAPFQLVHSNLVLHNLPPAAKGRTLEVLFRLLGPDGAFVWGDLIRFADPRLQRARVETRIRHAREAGCPEPLVEWNFQKEAEEDFPLTAIETLALLAAAGFVDPEVVWARDTFLVVRALKPGGGVRKPFTRA